MNFLQQALSYIFTAANWGGPAGLAARIAEHLQYTVVAVLMLALGIGDEYGDFQLVECQLVSQSAGAPVDVKAMPERLSASMLNRRAAMWIRLVFAGLAMTLSAIGIYGVLAYTVAQRTREFGIRLALGAQGSDVVGMVLGHGVKLAAIGLAIGIGGAAALTRLMTAMLFEVKPTEPGVFVAVAVAVALMER